MSYINAQSYDEANAAMVEWLRIPPGTDVLAAVRMITQDPAWRAEVLAAANGVRRETLEEVLGRLAKAERAAVTASQAADRARNVAEEDH